MYVSLKILLIGLSTSLLVETVSAHGRWIVPSHTILSGEDAEYISLDFSISNEIFHADIPYGGVPVSAINQNVYPETTKKSTEKAKVQVEEGGHATATMRRKIMLEQFASTHLHIVKPHGEVETSNAIVNLGRKSASAVLLESSGTYAFSVRQKPILLTLYTHKDGSPGREFGFYEQVKDYLPQGYKAPKTLRIHNNVITYVTRNQTTREVLKADKDHLSLVFEGHPNDLFANETAKLRLLIKGKPAKNTELHVIPDRTRYRNERNAMTITTDNEGQFSINWKTPGLYFIEAEWEEKSKDSAIDNEVYALYVTLEVNAE